MPAKQAMFAVTILTCGILACSECDGALQAAHAKFGRPANPAAAVGREHRKIHRAVGRAPGLPVTRAHGSMVRKSSTHKRYAAKPTMKAQLTANRHGARRKKLSRLASGKSSSQQRQTAMLGLASFYSEDTETASGDPFDKNGLTAAHPTLPFGTRLRVTNVRNGRSVTVRVNDRGPFIGGRIIDVTSAAARALGMVDAGVVQVTLDVVR
jgi:rare lipoprotein A (peptidoglycan hydrolase)